MNINRGLRRVWIVGSVLWVALLLERTSNLGFSFSGFLSLIVGFAIWWLLYWGISGFFDDEKEKGGDRIKGESDHSKKAFKERQRIRFQPLRTRLDELVASMDSKYIETKIWDGNKVRGFEVEGYYIAVGDYPFDLIEEYVIEPGFFFKDNMDKAMPIEKGFIVTKLETDYNSGSQEYEFQTKTLFNQGRQAHEFLTEEEVFQYIEDEITKALSLWHNGPLKKHKYTFSDASKELSSLFSLGRWLRKIKDI